MFALSAIVLIDLIGVIVTGQLTAVVPTTSGPVQGEILRTAPNSLAYSAFKGIKYAEAPVGSHRFKPPVPVHPWTSTFNATTEGSQCPQFDFFTNTVIGSEDCLFLNVFTPRTSLALKPIIFKPVMVWIHGGAFTYGSGSTEIQRLDYLLEKDVVIVTLNYRLGALGFLSLDHPDVTGNAGLKDQNLALKWINSNIARFGGNRRKITIFGQSAGAASVGYHTISDASSGLFHGVISMSGTPLAPWAFQTTLKAVSVAEHLAQLMGITWTDKETLLEALYDATPATLVTSALAINLISPFTPTTENANIAQDPFLTENPYRKYYTGNYRKVPQMLGFLDQETITTCYFTTSLPIFLETINMALDEARNNRIQDPESLITIRDLIMSGGDLSQVDPYTLQAAINITTEMIFISSIDRTQKFFAANNDRNPVYYYHISFFTDRTLQSSVPGATPGAGHGDDLAYIFYIPSANFSTNPNDPIARTIRRVSTMWTNFAKYDDPTPYWTHNNFVDVIWPNSGDCGYNLDIGYDLVVGPRPINDDTALIQLLSWPAERESLGIPGLIRPNPRV